MRPSHQLRCLFASAAFVVLFTFTLQMARMSAQEKAGQHKSESEKAAASEASPIERLGAMIAGTWAIDATSEPRETGSKVGKDTGQSVIRFGPSKLALIEDYRTHGDDGDRASFGIFWWDGKAPGYRTMFCDDRDPGGCSLYNGLGNWEGADWVFRTEFETKDKKKVKVREVLTATSPSSFTATFYRGVDDGPMKLDWTVKHTKIDAH
jgi:hypothetical protein